MYRITPRIVRLPWILFYAQLLRRVDIYIYMYAWLGVSEKKGGLREIEIQEMWERYSVLQPIINLLYVYMGTRRYKDTYKTQNRVLIFRGFYPSIILHWDMWLERNRKDKRRIVELQLERCKKTCTPWRREAILKSLKIEETALKGIGLNHETHSSLMPLFSTDIFHVPNYHSTCIVRLGIMGRKKKRTKMRSNIYICGDKNRQKFLYILFHSCSIAIVI